jgi:hypothetical protein
MSSLAIASEEAEDFGVATKGYVALSLSRPNMGSMLFLPRRSWTPGAHSVFPRPRAMTSAGTELGPMCIVWPVMSLRVCIPCVRTWLCSPSMGAAAANELSPADGPKPLVGGGISATLLMEFFSSPSDFSACCSLAQMRSQSCPSQHFPLPHRRM